MLELCFEDAIRVWISKLDAGLSPRMILLILGLLPLDSQSSPRVEVRGLLQVFQTRQTIR